MATVINKKYSGFGHQLHNLVPCCKDCNSSKGNKNRKTFLEEKGWDTDVRVKLIENHLSSAKRNDLEIMAEVCAQELKELEKIRESILLQMKEADKVAELLRKKVRLKSS